MGLVFCKCLKIWHIGPMFVEGMISEYFFIKLVWKWSINWRNMMGWNVELWVWLMVGSWCGIGIFIYWIDFIPMSDDLWNLLKAFLQSSNTFFHSKDANIYADHKTHNWQLISVIFMNWKHSSTQFQAQ